MIRSLVHERSGRRHAGYVLAAVLVVGWVLVQVAWVNPWRLLVLYRLSAENVTLTIWAVAVAFGVVTVLVGLRRRWAVPVAAVVVSVAVLVAGVVAVNRHLHADVDPGFRQASEAVVATSDDGRFQVVTTSHRGDADADFWYEEYHVESRDGLLSRRSDFFAVLDHPLDAPGPRVESVAFTGGPSILLTTSDGRRWTVAMDPDTVEVSHWLRSCDDDGGLCWTPASPA